MYKICRPVLVAHNNINTPLTLYHDGILSDNVDKLQYHINQHLHIISIDEKIEVEDWYIDDTNTLRQSVTSDKDYWEARLDYKKIIASTNKSLRLPQPSPEYIQQFIAEYNAGDVRCIEVEYEGIGAYLNPKYSSDYQLKLTNSYIAIKPIKAVVYSEEEVLEIRNELKLILKWFNEHKKKR